MKGLLQEFAELQAEIERLNKHCKVIAQAGHDANVKLIEENHKLKAENVKLKSALKRIAASYDIVSAPQVAVLEVAAMRQDIAIQALEPAQVENK